MIDLPYVIIYNELMSATDEYSEHFEMTNYSRRCYRQVHFYNTACTGIDDLNFDGQISHFQRDVLICAFQSISTLRVY
jgi:hypothetical protein